MRVTFTTKTFRSQVPSGLEQEVQMVEVSATVDGHEYRHIAALPPADYPARRRQGAVDLIVASSLKELNLKVSDGKAKRRRATR